MNDPKPRVVEQAIIECTCGEFLIGDSVRKAQIKHVQHILSDHDVPGVNRHQYQQTLKRLKGESE